MPAKLIALLLATALLWLGEPARAATLMSAGSAKLLETRLIDIGGRRLNLICIGEGSPTIVFDQAWGGTILDWQYVQEEVSKLTRSCFYDRAGEGYSDPSARPGTPQNATDDLRALIRRAGLGQRVVLVGHSLGGLHATVYTDRFFDEVAGLVLVDPAFAEMDDVALPEADRAVVKRTQAAGVERMSACEALAREGRLSLAEPHGCFRAGLPYYTSSEAAHVLPTFQRPERWAALRSQQGQHRAAAPFARRWGDKPVVVLTRDKYAFPGLSAEAARSYEASWKKGHVDLAARSMRGRHQIVPNSRHYIQAEQPAAVVAAIREVLAEVRDSR